MVDIQGRTGHGEKHQCLDETVLHSSYRRDYFNILNTLNINTS
jgi:hypothetical protein